MATADKVDVYTKITNRIVEQLEKGVRPWMQPWSGRHIAGSVCRPLRHNGQKYSGINVLSLWLTAFERGYISPFWATFKQIQELGGHVKKGEKGSPVVYANTITKKEQTEEGDEVEREIPFLRAYTVFAADQTEGLPPHFYQLAEPSKPPAERITQADAFFANTKADIRTGGNRAFYVIDEDYIQLPPFELFRDAESHAAVLAHEAIHWTRHPSRLGRDFGRKRFGDLGYATEELVAEIGSAFLCADLAITPEVREDHAAYIENWLTVLKNDRHAVFTAASHASKASEYLHNLQPKEIV